MCPSNPLQTPAYWVCFAGMIVLTTGAVALNANVATTQPVLIDQRDMRSIAVAHAGRHSTPSKLVGFKFHVGGKSND